MISEFLIEQVVSGESPSDVLNEAVDKHRARELVSQVKSEPGRSEVILVQDVMTDIGKKRGWKTSQVKKSLKVLVSWRALAIENNGVVLGDPKQWKRFI